MQSAGLFLSARRIDELWSYYPLYGVANGVIFLIISVSLNSMIQRLAGDEYQCTDAGKSNKTNPIKAGAIKGVPSSGRPD